MVNFVRMRTLMRQITTAERNVRMAWSVATKCTQTLSDMPKGGSQRECQVVRGGDLHMEAEDVLRALRAELKKEKEELSQFYPYIIDEKARKAVELRYMCEKSIQGVAVAMGYSDRHAKRKVKEGEAAVMRMKEGNE